MIFKNPIKRILIIAAIFPALIFSGCGVWNNFTTYFNLYYNTSDQFETAEATIYEQKRDLFSTQELIIPSSATQALNKVVEKASKILQFHPESGFVDDALLMLGKSFYYQKNYLKALRKFQELLATQQGSDLALETKLWIGKTQMRLKNFDEGLATLTDVVKESSDEGEDEILQDAYIQQIVHKISIEDFQGAISLSNELLDVSGDDEVNAEIEFELGKLYNDVGDTENAIASFKKVFNFSPTFDIQYGANIELGKALRENKQDEEAYNLFSDMRDNAKYIEDYDEIDLQSGITLMDLNRIDEAKNIFADVDTSYPNSLQAGYARFELAKIFETDYNNFDSASFYYQKASTTQAPPEISKAALDKSQKFKKYENLNRQIGEDRQSLIYALDSAAFSKDSSAYFDSLKAQQEAIQNEAISERSSELPNRGGGRGTREFESNQIQSKIKKISDQKPPIKPTISADSIMSRIAKSEFEIANLFFTEFNLLDSAYYHYKRILSDYPNSPYNAKTLYAIGSYYEAKNEKAKADSIFNFIYENYKTESIVNAAASKINKPLINLNYDPAEDLYAEAEKQMLDSKFAASVNNFYNIFKTYPTSDYAPKALYAGGWILENELNKSDSAAVMYDSIASNYPKTIYASKITPKLSFYKAEKLKAKRAIEDSLNALNKKNIDTTKNVSQPVLENENNLNADSTVINSDSNNDTMNQVDDNLDPAEQKINNLTPNDSLLQPQNENLNRINEDELLNGKTNTNSDTLKIIQEK